MTPKDKRFLIYFILIFVLVFAGNELVRLNIVVDKLEEVQKFYVPAGLYDLQTECIKSGGAYELLITGKDVDKLTRVSDSGYKIENMICILDDTRR